MVYEIKSLSIVLRALPEIGACAICCFKPVVQHRNECKRGAGIRYKTKLVRIHALERHRLEFFINDRPPGDFGQRGS